MSEDALAELVTQATFDALGLAATWRPVLGDAQAITVLRTRGALVLPGLGGGSAYHDGIIVEVRTAEVASPAKDDVIEIGERSWRVRSAVIEDAAGLVWKLDCIPA
jgi:hypothetical protein